MSEPYLPPQFEELERFAPTWCLPSGEERFAQLMRSSMAEMHELYDAAFPRLQEVRHLFELVLSTIVVAMCVEIWHQPNVIDGADARLDRVAEPRP